MSKKNMKILLLCCISWIVAFTFSGCDHSNYSDMYYLYIGTFTTNSHSKGIYIYKFNAFSGKLDSVGATTDVKDPSFLAISPDKKYLYSVNELNDSTQASVSSFAIDKTTGKLTFLNKQSSRGSRPCYVDINNKGTAAFVGNYAGGSFSMLPIKQGGYLAEPSVTIVYHGSSIKPQQQSPHVHCTILSPDNSRLFVVDLGTDKIRAYTFNQANLQLASKPSFVYHAKAGDGPRHLTFSPNGQFAYLITELSGTVVAFQYKNHDLMPIQSISNAPKGYNGNIGGSEIHISPDGNFLYVSNRGDLNDIVIYAINHNNGKLTKVGRHSSGGVNPRYFMIDQTGKYLLSANSKTNNIVVFRRNKKTGKLSLSGNEIHVPEPVCLKMIPVN
jgi:6-phosphogluconolactonase